MAIEDATVAPFYKRGVGGKEEGLCLASSLAYVGTHRRRPFPRGRIGKGLLTSRMDRASHGKRKEGTDKR